MVAIAIVRHGQRVPLVDPEVLPDVPEELEPEPVSVETLPEVDGAVEVVSLVVDEVVGVVVFAVEPGVALVPELLYVLLRSLVCLWQPGSADVASARTAR